MNMKRGKKEGSEGERSVEGKREEKDTFCNFSLIT